MFPTPTLLVVLHIEQKSCEGRNNIKKSIISFQILVILYNKKLVLEDTFGFIINSLAQGKKRGTSASYCLV
jgi:hypothetical protein